MDKKERKKRVTLPGLYFDNQRFVPASQYPGFTVYTDKGLADLLNVSPMRVGMWRSSNKIPYKMSGNYAVYSVNAVLEALQKQGYEVDPNLKSRDV